MLMNTRRRALGLLLAAAAGMRFFPQSPRARAAENEANEESAESPENAENAEPEQKECYDTQKFGPWLAQATDTRAGARTNDVPFKNPETSPLRADVHVSASYDSKLVLYADPDKVKLNKKFLKNPDNRLIARDEDGKESVNEPLCGNCTDIEEDKVSVVMPLATAPLLRDGPSIEIAIKLIDQEECGFKLNCTPMHRALEWAAKRKEELAKAAAEQECAPPGDTECFITTACCEVLGLADDCFELRSLRHYRDRVLAKEPGGIEAIALYYELAPKILSQLPQAPRRARLLAVYARYILPASLAARFNLSGLTYRLYVRMLGALAQEFAPHEALCLRIGRR
jgi:hypothetical protein